MSYDPDRWLSATNYSRENTGIDYRVTRGIVERRYKYVSPSGQIAFGKLTRPTEKGTYLVSMTVMDEYGAWSDWYDQTIDAEITLPNRPPTVQLTFPNGSQANPSFVDVRTPVIKWNQHDPDPNTTFAAFQVIVKNENGTIFQDSGIQPQGTTNTYNNWQMTKELALGQKYQVQVRVSDGIDWSGWSNIGWMITNRPPAARMIVPNGTKDKPTMMETLRPTLQWRQTDPDPGTVFKAYQLQITDESGTVILDTGQKTQNTSNTSVSWKVDRDLPPRKNMQVRVRVHDGHVWSPWSPQTWMMINRPPRADFNWSPKPVWEGDAVEVFSLSTDPDDDPLSYEWLVVSPDGTRKSYDTPRFNAKWMEPGRVEVKLTVSDGLASDSITKTIIVQELTIQSEVHHTPKWLKNHEERGHNTTEPPKDFYSGEVFVVQTESAPAPVKEASASLRAKGKDGTTIDITTRLEPEEGGVRFHGELYDEQLGSLEGGLPTGLHSIHFEIIYENGVVKEEDVPICIIGSVHQFVGVHRIQ